jgi:acyl carrier protein
MEKIITMEKKELAQKVNEVLAEEFEIELSEIAPDANIKETLQLDSLSLVDMVALIENEFGVKIKTQEVATINSFDDLYQFIQARLN